MTMPRGRRRPPGSGLNRKTREVAARAAEAGITPLELMPGTMRDLYAAGHKIAGCGIAEKCAPYRGHDTKVLSASENQRSPGNPGFDGLPNHVRHLRCCNENPDKVVDGREKTDRWS
jgi:hypothetical protein